MKKTKLMLYAFLAINSFTSYGQGFVAQPNNQLIAVDNTYGPNLNVGIGTLTPDPTVVLNTDGFTKFQNLPFLNPAPPNQIRFLVLDPDDNVHVMQRTWPPSPPLNVGDDDWYKEGTNSSPNSIDDNIYTNGKVGIGVGLSQNPIGANLFLRMDNQDVNNTAFIIHAKNQVLPQFHNQAQDKLRIWSNGNFYSSSIMDGTLKGKGTFTGFHDEFRFAHKKVSGGITSSHSETAFFSTSNFGSGNYNVTAGIGIDNINNPTNNLIKPLDWDPSARLIVKLSSQNGATGQAIKVLENQTGAQPNSETSVTGIRVRGYGDLTTGPTRYRIGLDVHVEGADVNYAAMFNGGSVGIGTGLGGVETNGVPGLIEESALLELQSTTQGFLPPRMNCSDRNNILSAVEGLLIYNNETHHFNFFNGSDWVRLDEKPVICSAPVSSSSALQIKSTNSEIEVLEDRIAKLENLIRDLGIDINENVEQKTSFSSSTLKQNIPNPFSDKTTISYKLDKSGFVTLEILGREGVIIEQLVNENIEAGEYSFEWTPRNLPSGIYTYVLRVNGELAAKKALYLK